MAKSGLISAGLLLCRAHQGEWQFLLAHPGGPFFARKDDGAWSIPKGLIDPGEDPLCAAQREFREETGFVPPEGPYEALGEIVQKGGKRVRAWAVVGEAELIKLTGLQQKLAAALIKARPFKSFDELVNVKGIGDKTVHKLRGLFTL